MPGRRVALSNQRITVPLSVGVVGLALIGIGQSVPNRHSIEHDLTARSTQALQKADLVDLIVSFSGRDATITGSAPAEVAQRAESVVGAVDGVRVAKAKFSGGGSAATPAPIATPAPVATPTPAPTAAVPDIPLGFTLVDGGIKVTGTVRAKATEEALISAVQAAGHGWKVTDKLAVDPGLASEPLAADRFPALGKLIATAPIGGTKLVIQYNADTVILRGTPATAADAVGSANTPVREASTTGMRSASGRW